jgi:preprotein translocase subunit SecG
LVVIEVLCCLMLIGVILLQKTKGQGMGLAFGAAMGESLFGARVGNVLTKTTVILAIVFLVNTTILAMMGTAGRRAGGSVAEGIPTASAPAAPAAPAGGGEGGGLPLSSRPGTGAGGMPPVSAPVAEPAPSVPPPSASLPAPAPAGAAEAQP